MLFNSYIFIFIYFPIVFSGLFLINKFHPLFRNSFLLISSISFYAWWDYRFVHLLLLSIIFNYLLGISIIQNKSINIKKILLITGLIINVSILCYFKYSNFFLNEILNYSINLQLILPIGISFYTFTQIAYLVDSFYCINSSNKKANLIDYALFVTWFPHLIAGPILHHKDIISQFNVKHFNISYKNLYIGLSIFIIGLFKKIILADQFSDYVIPVHQEIQSEHVVSFIYAWTSAVAYSLQLYFDFSGYSDMALGISKMMSISIPINFDSPYKSTSLIEFWRKWHMTLSRFLRDYLYIPMGGNRKGAGYKYIFLFITMFVAGFWHGAGWTFIIWGVFHGLGLIFNYLWIKISSPFSRIKSLISYKLLCVLVTFTLVTIAWVPFRADSLANAHTLIKIMMPIGDPASIFTSSSSLYSLKFALMWICIGLLIVWGLPNTQNLIFNRGARLNIFAIPLNKKIEHVMRSPSIMGILFALSLACLRKNSEFLYFQF